MGHAYFSLGKADVWLGKPGNKVLTTKRLHDGYLPIVIADSKHVAQPDPGPKYEQTAVAWCVGCQCFAGATGCSAVRPLTSARFRGT